MKGRLRPSGSARARVAVLAAMVGAAVAAPLHAQQPGAVAGTVTDLSSTLPVPTARVVVTGTGLEAVTDAQGRYRIAGISPGRAELRVERIGYRTMTRSVSVEAGSTRTEDFALLVEAIALDELVVTATGIQRRRELGNATSTLQVPTELQRSAPTTLAGMLQGRATGVQVLQSSGTVGGTSTVKIRGNSSMSLGNTPLIYVDGSRVSNNISSGPGVGGQSTSRLNDLNLDEVESIEIVKGPSAATLYGTEAAAGVIRITTRRGSAGGHEWTVRSDLGANWDATDWPETVFHPRSIFEGAPDILYPMDLLDGEGGVRDFGTPWRTGIEQGYGLSLQGGVDNVTYFVSGGLGHRQGSLPNNEAGSRNVRANLTLRPSPRTDVTVSSAFGSNEAFLPDNDNNGFGYIGVAALGFPWYKPITASDPLTGEDGIETCPFNLEAARFYGRTISSIQSDPDFGPCPDNPFFGGRTFDDVRTLENEQKVERFTGSVTTNYRPASFLDAGFTLGYDQFSDQTRQYVPVETERRPFQDLSLGWRSVSNVVNRSLTVEANLNASLPLPGGFSTTTSVGTQYSGRKAESASSIGRVLPPGVKTVSSAVTREGFESIGEARTLGLFLQQQVAFEDRLFLTPAVRMDRNSAFGENLGWRIYPRAMASWVVSEEGWFSVPHVNALRLRAAWGTSGKQPIGSAALPFLGARAVTFENRDVSGVLVLGPANPDLKPETGREIELGFEGAFLGGRLGADVTWFHQTTDDAIVTRRVAPSTGYSASEVTNLGQVMNTGVELGLDVVAMDRPGLRWDWRLNASTVRGEITRLGRDEPIIFGLHGDSQRHDEGYPYASYFSREHFIGDDGSVQSTEEPVFLGHPTPEIEGSLSSTVTLFGSLSLHATLGFAGGHQQFNSTEEFQCGFLGGGTYGGVCRAIYERDANGELTDEARIKAAAAEDIQYSPWIEDADFARLRVVSARIDLPRSWVQRVGGSRASFSLVGENLALFTGYSGLDPEINFAGGSQSTRAEFLTLPPARRVTGRLTITF